MDLRETWILRGAGNWWAAGGCFSRRGSRYAHIPVCSRSGPHPRRNSHAHLGCLLTEGLHRLRRIPNWRRFNNHRGMVKSALVAQMRPANEHVCDRVTSFGILTYLANWFHFQVTHQCFPSGYPVDHKSSMRPTEGSLTRLPVG
jgi:hypothetical protein